MAFKINSELKFVKLFFERNPQVNWAFIVDTFFSRKFKSPSRLLHLLFLQINKRQYRHTSIKPLKI